MQPGRVRGPAAVRAQTLLRAGELRVEPGAAGRVIGVRRTIRAGDVVALTPLPVPAGAREITVVLQATRHPGAGV